MKIGEMHMKKNYFSLGEDFEKIIKNSLKDKEVIKMNNISTGWTNIVYEVNTNCRELLFQISKR